MTAAPPRTDGWVGDRFGVRLHTDTSVVGWDLSDLVGLALRRNPRRAHLLVSTLLGKHIPVDPELVRGAGALLGLLVGSALGEVAVDDIRPAATALHDGDAGPVLALSERHRPTTRTAVFGFAETATGLGHCVAEALHTEVYVHSTRREIDGVPVATEIRGGALARDRPSGSALPGRAADRRGRPGPRRRRAVHRHDGDGGDPSPADRGATAAVRRCRV